MAVCGNRYIHTGALLSGFMNIKKRARRRFTILHIPNGLISILSTIILVVGCFGSKEEDNQGNDSIPLLDTTKERELVFRMTDLRDTTLNGVNLNFALLTEKEYKSLKYQVRQTTFPLQLNSASVSRTDSCLLITLKNGKIDSLCNQRKGDYFEHYNIKGIWKEKGLVLVNYEDWEGGSDFFINLQDGKYYYLNSNYELSPDSKLILSFVDLNETAFIPAGLMLTTCENGSISTAFNIEFQKAVTNELLWVTSEQCVISTGTLGKNFEVDDVKYYKLALKF
jgi:hypothetical protein